MTADWHSACGKVILFGEHAVVYGYPAIAAGLPDMVRAKVCKGEIPGVAVCVPAWGFDNREQAESPMADALNAMLESICARLGIQPDALTIEVHSELPPGSGLGASAALAVALVKSLAAYFAVTLTLETINDIAFECEKHAHGRPSGLDNTLATYGGLLQFQRGEDGVEFAPIADARPLTLLVAHCGERGVTAEMVERVRVRRAAEPALVEQHFEDIAALVREAPEVLRKGDWAQLAHMFNLNHERLRALGVSSPALETLREHALAAGAEGVKLTGSGGGGASIVLASEPETVRRALVDHGYRVERICLQGSSNKTL